MVLNDPQKCNLCRWLQTSLYLPGSPSSCSAPVLYLHSGTLRVSSRHIDFLSSRLDKLGQGSVDRVVMAVLMSNRTWLNYT